MEARVIHTKIWADGYFHGLKPEGKLLFLWLVTNEYIDVLGVIEVPVAVIAQQTGINAREVAEWLAMFGTDGKLKLYGDYIYVRNAYKYQTYSGIKNANPKLRTIFEMSDEVILFFAKEIGLWMSEIDLDIKPYRSSPSESYQKLAKFFDRVDNRYAYLTDTGKYTPISTPIHTAQKTEIRNKKPETQIEKEEMGNQKLEMSEHAKQLVERLLKKSHEMKTKAEDIDKLMVDPDEVDF